MVACLSLLCSKDTVVPSPLSFAEGVSFIGGA